jgi:hypothetical protein
MGQVQMGPVLMERSCARRSSSWKVSCTAPANSVRPWPAPCNPIAMALEARSRESQRQPVPQSCPQSWHRVGYRLSHCVHRPAGAHDPPILLQEVCGTCDLRGRARKRRAGNRSRRSGLCPPACAVVASWTIYASRNQLERMMSCRFRSSRNFRASSSTCASGTPKSSAILAQDCAGLSPSCNKCQIFDPTTSRPK